MTPFLSFHLRVSPDSDLYQVEFYRLKRTEQRATQSWWPRNAISGMRCILKEVEPSEDKTCSRCSFGLSFRHKNDEINLHKGLKLALARALQPFDKEFRKEVWKAFFHNMRRLQW